MPRAASAGANTPWLRAHFELGRSGTRFAKAAGVSTAHTRRLLVALLISALGIACTDAPMSPTPPAGPSLPPAVNLTGTWQGQYVEVACQSTTCPVCCTSRGKTERRRDLCLVITQDDAHVTGFWTEAPLEFQGTLGGSFAGTVSGTSVVVAGVLFPVAATTVPFPVDSTPYRLADFSAQAAGPAGPLTGSFFIVTIDASGRETQRLRNDLVSLARVP